MRLLFAPISFFLSFSCLVGQPHQKVSFFDLKDVRLLDGPFKTAQDRDREYLLELDADKLLSPFLREAGLPVKADSYTNWENTGLDGHIGGHYVSALSYMFASTGDKQIGDRLNYMISQLKLCQDKTGTGYIGGVPNSSRLWDEIAKGDIRASNFGLNGGWVPLYNIHKTYNGLRDAYLVAGNATARDMLVKMTDWIIGVVANLSDDQIQDMLRSEHGGLNEVFADVAAITGDEKYLKLAHRFSHLAILNPLIEGEDKLTGLHANTQIPKVIGFKRIADLENNRQWDDASRFFWETVVKHRSVTIGGNSVHEHFHPSDDFSAMMTSVEGPETCNTYNMLHLSRMLYQSSLDKGYMDFYERGLFNHILSSQNPNNGGLVYFTPMRSGHYRVYSQPHTSMWCCVGSGLESHAKHGEAIYAHSDNDLYVNLFISSKLNWKQNNTEVIMNTSFPDDSKIDLTINPDRKTRFGILVRIPSWTDGKQISVMVNGKKVGTVVRDGYAVVDRNWKKGDHLTIDMPMRITAEQMPDKSNYYSLLYGPIVLASTMGNDDMTGLYADDSRGGHIAHGPLKSKSDVPMLVGAIGDVVANVEHSDVAQAKFTVKDIYAPNGISQLELVPFYKVHDTRYVIYFQNIDNKSLNDIIEKTKRDEQEYMQMIANTVDVVSCGEQQPESDHFIAFDNSAVGYGGKTHWRDAAGWFGYTMRNKNSEARYLFVRYFDGNDNRETRIFINDKMVSVFKPLNNDSDKLSSFVVELPHDQVADDKFVVKFVPVESGRTARVAEVRLLRAK